jgi:P4 family phage/plasmid primase-like protien
MVELLDILKKFQKKDDKSTHSIIPGGDIPYLKNGWSLYVPQDKLEKFNEDIHHIVFKQNKYIALTETFGEYSPLYIDIDLKYYNSKTSDRLYTNDTILELIKLIRIHIDKYIKCEDEKYKECWVMEKDHPILNKQNGLLKDGIHLMFPNIIGEYKIFKYNFIKSFSDKETDILDIFRNTSSKLPDNDVKDIFDGNVSKWFTYGCGKPDNIPYLVTKIVQYDDDKLTDNYYDSEDILKKLCLVKKFENNIEYKNNLDTLYSPTLKTSVSSNSVSFMDSDFEDDDEDDNYDPYGNKEDDETGESISETLIKDEIDFIYKIVLNCISVKRVEDYDLWIKLGMCLKNHGGDKLFKLWDTFSKKGSNYKDETDCRKFWDGFKRDGLTIATLHWWARMDNIDGYRELKEDYVKDKIEYSISNKGQHDDVAEVVYRLYRGEYICADLKQQWYYFNDTRWIICPKGWKLQEALTKRIKMIYKRYHKKYMDEGDNSDNTIDKESYEARQKSAYSIYQSLKSVTYQNNIIESCKIKFYVDKVMNKFDSDTKLMGFDNCVFDMRENILREGRPNDYITMTNNINLPIYKNELPLKVSELKEIIQQRVGKVKIDNYGEEIWDTDKWDDGNDMFYKSVKRDINKFFYQILPNKELRKYCVKFIASRLSGDVLEQRFSIITGCGANGKSILIDLIRNVLGEYCLNLPVTLLTQKRKASNAACPEKAQTKGVRLCYMQEPDSGEKINAGEMKELTGGDVITARKLYQDVFSFKPQFELLLMCNEKPIIDDKTNGAWRRVQVYPFESRFVDDEKLLSDEKKIFRKDKTLATKIKKWDIIFMSILMEEWINMEGGMNEDDIPASIRMETEAYKNQNDMIGTWITENLVPCDNTLTPFKELFNDFETWKDDNCSNFKIDKIQIKKRLIEWQTASKYTYSKEINGKNNPKINLKIIQE